MPRLTPVVLVGAQVSRGLLGLVVVRLAPRARLVLGQVLRVPPVVR